MQKILIPTDFSDNARKAAEYAFHLFGKEPEYTLFHSYFTPNYAPDMVVSVDDMVSKQIEKELKQEAEELKSKHEGLKLETRSMYGEAVDTIDTLCDELKPDLIVMGTKGAGSLAEAILGSTTSSVIQNVLVPVLAVPEQALVAKPEKIVFAADLRKISDDNVLLPLKELTQKAEAQIHALNVMEEKEAPDLDKDLARRYLEDQFAGLDYEYHIEFLRENAVEDVIDSFVHAQDADLIAMIARRENFFNRIFHKSVTNRMALYTDIPLLAMHDLG